MDIVSFPTFKPPQSLSSSYLIRIRGSTILNIISEINAPKIEAIPNNRTSEVTTLKSRSVIEF